MTWTPSGASTPSATATFSAVPCRTTKTSALAGSLPSRTSAAGGTTRAPSTCPTRTAARAKSPPTRSARPGTSTTIWNERERSSMIGSMRAMRPSTRAPPSASRASCTAAPTFTFA